MKHLWNILSEGLGVYEDFFRRNTFAPLINLTKILLDNLEANYDLVHKVNHNDHQLHLLLV